MFSWKWYTSSTNKRYRNWASDRTHFRANNKRIRELELIPPKISSRISRTLGVMNRLKRYLPFSALKLMYSSLILSHLQYAIISWGFEWEILSKLQKRAIRMMTNNKYNAHTDPLFNSLKLLKINDIVDVQCMKFWYKFVNNNVPTYFASMFRYNHEFYDKLEAMDVNIYIRFVLTMPTMPWDIEFQSYVNFQLLSQKKPVLTALCRLLAMSNFTSSILIVPNVWSHNVTYVQSQRRNVMHLYQQRHLPSWK